MKQRLHYPLQLMVVITIMVAMTAMVIVEMVVGMVGGRERKENVEKYAPCLIIVVAESKGALL
jgi:hypothetical protein